MHARTQAQLPSVPAQVVLVTGGDSGIGRAAAVMMAKEGAKAVAIVYMPKEQQVGGVHTCVPLPAYVHGCSQVGAPLHEHNVHAHMQASTRTHLHDEANGWVGVGEVVPSPTHPPTPSMRTVHRQWCGGGVNSAVLCWQDAEDARKMIEHEGAEAILLAEDLSQGEEVCKRIVDQVGVGRGLLLCMHAHRQKRDGPTAGGWVGEPRGGVRREGEALGWWVLLPRSGRGVVVLEGEGWGEGTPCGGGVHCILQAQAGYVHALLGCAVLQLIGKFGKIDVLVNNAALQHMVPSIEETSTELVESTYK